MALRQPPLPLTRKRPAVATGFDQRSTVRPTQRREPASLLRQLGRWDLVRLVRSGPLASVYQARAAGSVAGQRAAYAVKVAASADDAADLATQAICREALVAGEVKHPHLVTVLAAHVARAPAYIVMPWLEGTTLAELSRRQRIDAPSALWYVRQAAEALEALHAAGWMHADVKPENLLVSRSGHVTLLDLGFARRPHDPASEIDRSVVGTIHYLAPEMASPSWRPDIRSDFYSLGVTLYELLAGKRPFEGPGLTEMIAQHREERPRELRRLNPHLPRELAALVHELMSKNPLRRPQTPSELIERLIELEVMTFGERGIG